MKKEAEEAEFWLGKESKLALIRTRGFIDKMSSLINLCIYKENRVLDIGQEDGNEEEEKEFEILNLSELQEQWDNEDS